MKDWACVADDIENVKNNLNLMYIMAEVKTLCGTLTKDYILQKKKLMNLRK